MGSVAARDVVQTASWLFVVCTAVRSPSERHVRRHGFALNGEACITMDPSGGPEIEVIFGLPRSLE